MSESMGAMLAGWEEIVAIEREEEYCEIGKARASWLESRMRETRSSDLRAILKTCDKTDTRKQDSRERLSDENHDQTTAEEQDGEHGELSQSRFL
jgi:hypothetical protein